MFRSFFCLFQMIRLAGRGEIWLTGPINRIVWWLNDSTESSRTTPRAPSARWPHLARDCHCWCATLFQLTVRTLATMARFYVLFRCWFHEKKSRCHSFPGRARMQSLFRPNQIRPSFWYRCKSALVHIRWNSKDFCFALSQYQHQFLFMVMPRLSIFWKVLQQETPCNDNKKWKRTLS